MSNNIPLFVILIVIGLTGYSIYQMNQDVNTLKSSIQTVMPAKPAPSKVQQKMTSCQQWKQKINTCLEDAQTCLKVLNQFSSKHREYERQVQECQVRNKKNSDRNIELRDQMKVIQDKLDELGTQKMDL